MDAITAEKDKLMRPLELRGKKALVTGASRGLGREMASALACAGAEVVCVARGVEDLEQAVADIRTRGGRALAVRADISSETDVAKMARQAVSELGHLDILIHSAGIMKAGSSFDMKLENWQEIIATNLTGAFLVCREVGCLMRDQGGGRMILIGSAFADRVFPFGTAYAVSKAGLSALLRNLAFEWARYGIRVNGIAPGYFETKMPQAILSDPKSRNALLKRIPVRRVGKPEELGLLAVYLASDASDYMNGTIVRIDGGQSDYTS